MKLVVQKYLIVLVLFLITVTSMQTVKAETIPKDDLYFTTEDIVLDLLMPTIDKRVLKEYEGNALFSWNWQRIVGINYNVDHSYDVSLKIKVPSENLDTDKEDFVKVRISPSCDSGKLNKLKCNHDFKIEILEYIHLSE
ncbi:hypothetical protein IEO70_16300 [Bacillus sp. AGMB 02131]|uniref:DUF3888 domain-containing protein n=1 Tax=Peribacillus faecalis TaxID=2772559 RepID=A0A927D0A2_9BACI|nr:hypothetical protein [Peribacillus faecalis]